MREAGIDPKTLPHHGTQDGVAGRRYTVIDDEAFDDAIEKMNTYEKRRGMIAELKELAAPLESLSDAGFQRFVALPGQDRSQQGSATARPSIPLICPKLPATQAVQTIFLAPQFACKLLTYFGADERT